MSLDTYLPVPKGVPQDGPYPDLYALPTPKMP
jgi:hypothetical protein